MLMTHTHTQVTGGNDRSLRLWQQTEEQVFLDEEKEEALEALFEQGLDKHNASTVGLLPGGVTATTTESSKATRASMETIRAGENLMVR